MTKPRPVFNGAYRNHDGVNDCPVSVRYGDRIPLAPAFDDSIVTRETADKDGLFTFQRNLRNRSRCSIESLYERLSFAPLHPNCPVMLMLCSPMAGYPVSPDALAAPHLNSDTPTLPGFVGVGYGVLKNSRHVYASERATKNKFLAVQFDVRGVAALTSDRNNADLPMYASYGSLCFQFDDDIAAGAMKLHQLLDRLDVLVHHKNEHEHVFEIEATPRLAVSFDAINDVEWEMITSSGKNRRVRRCSRSISDFFALPLPPEFADNNVLDQYEGVEHVVVACMYVNQKQRLFDMLNNSKQFDPAVVSTFLGNASAPTINLPFRTRIYL